MSKDWKEGQRITVHSHWRGAISTRTIVTVTSRKIVDSQGGEWEPGGRTYGTKSVRYYTGQSIKPFKEGDDTAVKRLNNSNLIKNFDFSELPDDALMVIANIIRDHKGKTKTQPTIN